MPRIARVACGDLVQHVINRGYNRAALFGEAGDWLGFTLRDHGRPRKSGER